MPKVVSLFLLLMVLAGVAACQQTAPDVVQATPAPTTPIVTATTYTPPPTSNVPTFTPAPSRTAVATLTLVTYTEEPLPPDVSVPILYEVVLNQSVGGAAFTLEADTIPWNETWVQPTTQMQLPAISDEVWRAFEAANQTPQNHAGLQMNSYRAYEWLSAEQIAALLPQGGTTQAEWPAFFEQYPYSVGLVGVSAIGFNQDGSQALLARRFTCGVGCGDTTLFYLEYSAQQWQVVEQLKVG